MKNQSNGNSAFLIEGARRIGKTTVAEEFGKNEFLSYKTIDFFYCLRICNKNI